MKIGPIGIRERRSTVVAIEHGVAQHGVEARQERRFQ
jgi:hypothetical protein